VTNIESFSIPGYRGDALDMRIQTLIWDYLNLEDDGEMMLPLKRHEIGDLWAVIRVLVENPAEVER
jgi:hypothetical protein